jgi:uncharacterized GH25 family protein
MLSGLVVNADTGQPLANVWVILVTDAHAHLTNPERLRTRTDENGIYHFENLKPGVYRVSAHLHGFQAEDKEAVVEPSRALKRSAILRSTRSPRTG